MRRLFAPGDVAFGPKEIAFGPSAEESDTIPAALWSALGRLLAHEVLFGRARPGVCLYGCSALSPRAAEFGVYVSAQRGLFAISPMFAERLVDRWMLATVVGVRQTNGEYLRFFAPTDLARLALEHTPALQDLVRHYVAAMQQSAA